MRRINPARFQVAKRGTGREINSQIVLNLVRTHQPISRADLARAMGVSRATVTLIVNDLLARQLVFEGATGETVRGRKPTFLYIDSRRRTVVAADIRASETFLMLADMLGKPLSGVISFPTVRDPKALVADAGRRIKALLAEHSRRRGLRGHRRRRARHGRAVARCACCTRRRWAGATSTCASRSPRPPGLRVQIENSGRACALAQMWALGGDGSAIPQGDLVFVSVSDGIGVGVIINGEVLRGRHNIAGEFGHIPLSLDGPRCSCGANGCWEAYISNRATLARYFGRAAHEGPQDAAAAALHDRGPDRPGARRRREGGRRARGHGALPRAGAGVGRQRARPGVRLHRRRNHARLGPDRGGRARGARRARADVGGRRHATSGRWPPASTRGCRAPRRWSPRRRSRRRSSRRSNGVVLKVPHVPEVLKVLVLKVPEVRVPEAPVPGGWCQGC